MYKTLGFLLLSIVTCIFMSGCEFPPRIYRMDVQQGNMLVETDIQKLKKGMRREDVRHLLGTPTLTHHLEANRWDYFYSFKSGSGAPTLEKHFSVFFKNDQVESWRIGK
jgi:outer membrane protein assembly factor BamE